ncbi:MAG: hypothetical protein HRU20_26150 [Pseudomonadales bacterium]|nr:hypothetical protein [Pseudomonadales bacterium]
MIPECTDCIVYQHGDWLLLNKPVGFSVQELCIVWSKSFPAFHPVHRLDKDTSGLWLIALNAKANQQLSQAFGQRLVKKAYLAITAGKPTKKQGRVEGDMQKSRRSQWQMLRSKENSAKTLFKSIGLKDGLRLVLCRPITGKTHQIRVAMKSLGAAVVGDSIYAASTATQYDRLYLHAYQLDFTFQGQDFSFQLLPCEGDLFRSAEFQAQMSQFQDPFIVLPLKSDV